MLFPSNIDDLKFIMENYKYLTDSTYVSTSTHTVFNRKIKTVTAWCIDCHCFITISNDYPNIIGYAGSSVVSEKEFLRLFKQYINNISKRGRHKKGNVLLGFRVPLSDREYIDSYCTEHNIHQGQFISELIHLHKTRGS